MQGVADVVAAEEWEIKGRSYVAEERKVEGKGWIAQGQ